MRHIVLAALFVFAGCAAQGLPLDDPTGGNGGAGGGGGSHAIVTDLKLMLTYQRQQGDGPLVVAYRAVAR